MRMLLFLVIAVMAMAAEYQVDKSRSAITFEATKMIFVGVEGSFHEFDGYIVAEEGTLVKFDGTVDAVSIDTQNAKRDDDLRSANFFDAGTYPQIRVLSEGVSEKTADVKVTIKERSHLLPFSIETFEVDGHEATLVLRGVIDRTLFGLDSSMMSAVINDDVEVKAVIVAQEMWEDHD